jgi:hypothetical protein
MNTKWPQARQRWARSTPSRQSIWVSALLATVAGLVISLILNVFDFSE